MKLPEGVPAHVHAGGVVRIVHVAAAGVAVSSLALAAWRPALARRLEWAFWTASLVLAVTGIGNLAALGGAAGGTWGTRFGVKLGLVLALLLASGTRALVLALDDRSAALRLAYGATAGVAVATLSLGAWLAHG